ncbi:MAG: TonB family protein [Acidobacteria bacterium]|nr:TonB family protein [Acidobacteriota bacterium]
MKHLHWRTFVSQFLLLAILTAIASAFSLTAFAQGKETKTDHSLDGLSLRPIHVTTRTFQMTAERGSYQDVNDQVFRMSTASLTNYDQWMNTFKKLYPEFEIDLLRADYRSVYRTSRPATISLVKQKDGREIEIQLNGAQSFGDGVTPGTTLVAEVALHFPNERSNKPLGFSIQPLEVESGKTYFFAVRNLNIRATDFVDFVRPNAVAENFNNKDIYLLFAFTVDLDTRPTPARLINEQQSVAFQEKATKKVVPEIPNDLRDKGFGGSTRVRVEVSPEGKVTSADVQYSTFPEINKIAVAAARQWEFPKSLFESDKNPITCYITFSFPVQPAAQKPSSSNSEK